jgi:hypothetical protein
MSETKETTISSQTPIHRRNLPWPAELFDHPQFIASLAKWYRPKLFIEYGVSSANATKEYHRYCDKIYGVDIAKHENHSTIPNLQMFYMSTREFKTQVLDGLTNQVEMAFIDADHDSKVAFQDFEDLFPHIIENGIIFLHDTFPCDETWFATHFCADSWKVPNMIKEKYGSVCEVLTIPVQPGLTVVKKYTKPLDYFK